jgi:hypothetical protein
MPEGDGYMLALKGVYENGSVTLPLPLPIKRRMEVIVTFLEEVDDTTTSKADLNSFSFAQSRQILKNFKGSCAEAVIEERRTAL